MNTAKLKEICDYIAKIPEERVDQEEGKYSDSNKPCCIGAHLANYLSGSKRYRHGVDAFAKSIGGNRAHVITMFYSVGILHPFSMLMWERPHDEVMRDLAKIEELPSLVEACLRGADLKWADLNGADLREADLSGADLSGADLKWADLRGADLREADLMSAVLRKADLKWADLRSAGLIKADLSGADLSGADLRNVGLQNADLTDTLYDKSTNWKDANLKGTILEGRVST